MRPETIRRSPLRILLLILLCSLQVFGVCQTARAQDNAPLRLTLSQAIDLALKQNRSLKLAQLAVVDNENKKEIARAAGKIQRQAGQTTSRAGIGKTRRPPHSRT